MGISDKINITKSKISKFLDGENDKTKQFDINDLTKYFTGEKADEHIKKFINSNKKLDSFPMHDQRKNLLSGYINKAMLEHFLKSKMKPNTGKTFDKILDEKNINIFVNPNEDIQKHIKTQPKQTQKQQLLYTTSKPTTEEEAYSNYIMLLNAAKDHENSINQYLQKALNKGTLSKENCEKIQENITTLTTNQQQKAKEEEEKLNQQKIKLTEFLNNIRELTEQQKGALLKGENIYKKNILHASLNKIIAELYSKTTDNNKIIYGLKKEYDQNGSKELPNSFIVKCQQLLDDKISFQNEENLREQQELAAGKQEILDFVKKALGTDSKDIKQLTDRIWRNRSPENRQYSGSFFSTLQGANSDKEKNQLTQLLNHFKKDEERNKTVEAKNELKEVEKFLIAEKHKYNHKIAGSELTSELANKLGGEDTNRAIATSFYKLYPVVATGIAPNQGNLTEFYELITKAVGQEYDRLQQMISKFAAARKDERLIQTEDDIAGDAWFKNGKNQLIAEFLSNQILTDQDTQNSFSAAITDYLNDTNKMDDLVNTVKLGGQNSLDVIKKATESGLINKNQDLNNELTKLQLSFDLKKAGISDGTITILEQAGGAENNNDDAIYIHLQNNKDDTDKLLNQMWRLTNKDVIKQITKAAVYHEINNLHKTDININVNELTKGLCGGEIENPPGFDTNFADNIKIGDENYKNIMNFADNLQKIKFASQITENIDVIKKQVEDKLHSGLKTHIQNKLGEDKEGKIFNQLLSDPTAANLKKASAALTANCVDQMKDPAVFFAALKDLYDNPQYNTYLTALQQQVTARCKLHQEITNEDVKKQLKSAELSRTDVARFIMENNFEKEDSFKSLHKNIPTINNEGYQQFNNNSLEYSIGKDSKLNTLFSKNTDALIKKFQSIDVSQQKNNVNEKDHAIIICENADLDLIKKIAKAANQTTSKEFTPWESFVLFIKSLMSHLTDQFKDFRVTNIELQKVNNELNNITKSNKIEQTEKSESFKELVDKISSSTQNIRR